MQDNSEDILLMNEISKGSSIAFDALYSKYSEAVYYTIYKKVKNKDDVDDVFQDFFVMLWRKRESINITTSFKAWLFTSLRNHILNHLLQSSRNEKKRLAFDKSFSEADFEAEEKMSIIDVPEFISEEINKLPEKMRIVWKLRREEDMSISEISAYLNSSEQTVKNQLTTANKRLRLFLSKLHTFLFFL